MAMALVRLQAVKRVPSSTLLLGAHVILMLQHVSYEIKSGRGSFLETGVGKQGIHKGATKTYRDPTTL